MLCPVPATVKTVDVTTSSCAPHWHWCGLRRLMPRCKPTVQKSFVFGYWHRLLACTAKSVHYTTQVGLHSAYFRLLPTCCKRHWLSLSACLVLLSCLCVCPRLSVSTCSALFANDGFFAEVRWKHPRSKILHLVILRTPFMGEGNHAPPAPALHTVYAPNHAWCYLKWADLSWQPYVHPQVCNHWCTFYQLGCQFVTHIRFILTGCIALCISLRCRAAPCIDVQHCNAVHLVWKDL